MVGAWGIIDIIIKKKRCTEYVEAIVVDFEIERSTDSDGNTSYSYYPVFEYRFEGKDYMKNGGVSSPFLTWHKGDRVGLYIDPDKPESFYCPKETIHKIIGFLIFAVAGAVVMYLLAFK
ncbi:DUF3592 domain-containing protein [Ruminococcus flavefaciens]|uniref:DUF3592 domain-containing protein n=1 Tax=Ruminococcus flavefaciens TaxID=1265 RepID=UPI00048F9D06|nr:DUF3592 domain-containing protein [Ruminococcus flavefaciens]